MGIVIGGTVEDLARMEILVSIGFRPGEGRRLKLNDIFEDRGTSESLKSLIEVEADRMVNIGFKWYTKKEGSYIFSRGEEGNYFWQPNLTLTNRIMDSVKSFFNKYIYY